MSVKHFHGQQPDETVLLILHRHWFPFVAEVVKMAALAILPVVAFFGAQNYFAFRFDPQALVYVVLVMAATLYYLVLIILFYGFWLDYYLDHFVITNKRIVDVQQDGLFHRTVAEQPVDHIQDVTSEMRGFHAHLFRYGSIYIQSAGKQSRFVIENADNPELVVKTIVSLTGPMIRPRPDGTTTEEKS